MCQAYTLAKCKPDRDEVVLVMRDGMAHLRDYHLAGERGFQMQLVAQARKFFERSTASARVGHESYRGLPLNGGLGLSGLLESLRQIAQWVPGTVVRKGVLESAESTESDAHVGRIDCRTLNVTPARIGDVLACSLSGSAELERLQDEIRAQPSQPSNVAGGKSPGKKQARGVDKLDQLVAMRDAERHKLVVSGQRYKEVVDVAIQQQAAKQKLTRQLRQELLSCERVLRQCKVFGQSLRKWQMAGADEYIVKSAADLSKPTVSTIEETEGTFWKSQVLKDAELSVSNSHLVIASQLQAARQDKVEALPLVPLELFNEVRGDWAPCHVIASRLDPECVDRQSQCYNIETSELARPPMPATAGGGSEPGDLNDLRTRGFRDPMQLRTFLARLPDIASDTQSGLNITSSRGRATVRHVAVQRQHQDQSTMLERLEQSGLTLRYPMGPRDPSWRCEAPVQEQVLVRGSFGRGTVQEERWISKGSVRTACLHVCSSKVLQ